MAFVDFLEAVLKLKDLKRTGWVMRNVQEPESVAAHSFNVALLCMLFAEDEKLNVEHCVKLALVHDLHEAICGDLVLKKHNAEHGISAAEKVSKEKESARELFKLLPSKEHELIKLSNEFLEGKTKEAIFVRDMDRLEACLQAFYYTRHNRSNADMSEFFANTRKRLRTKSAKRLFNIIEAAYHKL